MAWGRQTTTITWTSIDPDLCCHMPSLGHNESKQLHNSVIMLSFMDVEYLELNCTTIIMICSTIDVLLSIPRKVVTIIMICSTIDVLLSIPRKVVIECLHLVFILNLWFMSICMKPLLYDFTLSSSSPVSTQNLNQVIRRQSTACRVQHLFFQVLLVISKLQ